MKETRKKWAKTAAVIRPADRPAKLEHNPVMTSFTASHFAIPTRAIRRICQATNRSGYFESDFEE